VFCPVFEKVFQFQETAVLEALPNVQHPLKMDANLHLVPVESDQNLEEVVRGAHIAIHQRTPCCSLALPT
jgi:hypothetical protein